MGDGAFCVWVEAPMQRAASLIMHQRGKSIRDHSHLMHEADSYALKNTCPPLAEPPAWESGAALPSSPGPRWGLHPNLRHHFCPVPDKTLKHAWDVYSTMAVQHIWPPPPTLHPRLHVWCRTSLREETKKRVWSYYRRCSCRPRTDISVFLLCVWPLQISQIKSLIIYEG